MNIKTALILIACSVLLTAAITYFIISGSAVYDPLNDPKVQKIKRETELKDSLNNEIIKILMERIEDKEYIINNILVKQIEESKSRVSNLQKRHKTELEKIEALNEKQLEQDINSKLLSRKR